MADHQMKGLTYIPASSFLFPDWTSQNSHRNLWKGDFFLISLLGFILCHIPGNERIQLSFPSRIGLFTPTLLSPVDVFLSFRSSIKIHGFSLPKTIDDWIFEQDVCLDSGLEENFDLHDRSTEVILETLSDSPRVFYVENLFTPAEANQIIRNVYDESRGIDRLARSSVGFNRGKTKKRYSQRRTSENTFDTDSEVAMRLKKRAFRLLQMPWDARLSDGIQVLRYQLGQAYAGHNDYFKLDTTKDHNWWVGGGRKQEGKRWRKERKEERKK